MKQSVQFLQLKTTKNTVCYEEVPPTGKPPMIGRLYVQKWAVEPAPQNLVVTIDTDVPQVSSS